MSPTFLTLLQLAGSIPHLSRLSIICSVASIIILVAWRQIYCTTILQELHDGSIVFAEVLCPIQRSSALVRNLISVRAPVYVGAKLIDQSFHGVQVTIPDCLMQRLPSVGIGCADGGGIHREHVPQELRVAINSRILRFQMFDGCRISRWEGLAPVRFFFGSRNDVLRQFRGVDVLDVIGWRGFEMDEHIGHELALQWKRTSVDDGVGFVQHHVARFHRDVDCLAITADHFQRPRFIDILIDVDDCGYHQRQAIDMRCQDGILLVNADPIQAAFRQMLLLRPFRQDIACRIPDGLLQHSATTFVLSILDVQHVRRTFPVIDVGDAGGPALQHHLIAVGTPEPLDHVEEFRWCTDLGIPQLCVVVHAFRLSQGHGDASLLVGDAVVGSVERFVVLHAALQVSVVEALLVTKRLDRFVMRILSATIVLRPVATVAVVVGIGIARCEPCVVGVNVVVMHREGRVHTVLNHIVVCDRGSLGTGQSQTQTQTQKQEPPNACLLHRCLHHLPIENADGAISLALSLWRSCS
mmetsp:Transcript_3529/g.9375  ORF Transcript_3529/g.9375 Transcript_3529/m.9375 type:complete len:525 (+) Transcript_3529:81-1655(+)